MCMYDLRNTFLQHELVVMIFLKLLVDKGLFRKRRRLLAKKPKTSKNQKRTLSCCWNVAKSLSNVAWKWSCSTTLLNHATNSARRPAGASLSSLVRTPRTRGDSIARSARVEVPV